MNTIGFTKKYSSLSNAKGVNSLAEVSNIKNKEFTVYQHGQHWSNRLSCHINDSVRSLFSPLRKRTTSNEAWTQLKQDLCTDQSIQGDRRISALKKIEKWQKKGVPLRILRVRQLLRQLDKDFDSQAISVSVKSTLIPRTAIYAEAEICSKRKRLPMDGDRFDIGIPDSPQRTDTEGQEIKSLSTDEEREENREIQGSARTEATNGLAIEPETPRLDAVAQGFLTNNSNWEAPNIYEAVVELLDKNGIETTAEFSGFDDPIKANENKFSLASDVMVRFYKIAGSKKDPGEGKNLSSMTTEGFKDNFEKAFIEATSEKSNWFAYR